MAEKKRSHRHHSVHERVEAARAAAEEVVAEESGQLGSEVNALVVPLEEIAAAVRAAVDPDGLAESEVVNPRQKPSARRARRPRSSS